MTQQQATHFWNEHQYEIPSFFTAVDYTGQLKIHIIDLVLIAPAGDWEKVYTEMIGGHCDNETALDKLGLINDDSLEVILISNVLGAAVALLLETYLNKLLCNRSRSL